MMKNSRAFGKTWWGEAWIRTLEEIDYGTNRLPRGRRYARNGSVVEIKLKKNGEIAARVQGTRVTPYQEKISLPQFTEKQLTLIREIIEQRVDLSSQMMIGVLPQELSEVLHQQGIELFPHSWGDIDADCSCPDWANPCKHLAAVYYMIANEIDKDPYLLFEMHGARRELLLSAAKAGKKKRTIEDDFIKPTPEEMENPPLLPAPDLNEKTFRLADLLDILPEETLFYPHKSFKPILIEMYQEVSRFVRELPVAEESPDGGNIQISVLYSPEHPVFQVQSKPGRIIFGKLCSVPDSPLAFTIDEMTSHLMSLSLRDHPEDSASFRFIKQVFSFSLKVAENGSYIPRVIPLDENGSFMIRYFPSPCPYLDYLVKTTPPGMVKNESGLMMRKKKGVDYLCSLFLGEIVFRGFSHAPFDLISDVFFRGLIFRTDQFLERQTGMSISHWLEPLQFQLHDEQLLIALENTPARNFSLTLGIQNSQNPLAPIVSLDDFRRHPPSKGAAEGVFKQLGLLTHHSPLLSRAASKPEEPLLLSPDEMATFINTLLPVLDTLQVKVLMPKELREWVRPSLRLKVTRSGKQIVSYLSLDKIISFQWEITLGDTVISAEEFKTLLHSSHGVVQLRDRFVLVDPEELRRLLNTMKKPPCPASGLEVVRTLMTQTIDSSSVILDKEVTELLNDLRSIKNVQLPKDLQAEMRPYQKRGYRWIFSMLEKGFGICLADDMGLGKTLQTIAALLRKKESGQLTRPALVICPVSIIGNWQKECERFAPNLKVYLYHGSQRDLPSEVDLVVTSYGLVRRDIDSFSSREWSWIILDEAQNIKNPEAQQTQAVKNLNGEGKIALTGTPVENRLLDLWSIFDFLNPGYLGKRNEFINRYAIPIERYNHQPLVHQLHNCTEPFIMRRIKTDPKVIKDLPQKIVINEYVYLKPEQIALYQELISTMTDQIFESNGIKKKGNILKLLTVLKQVCNHPVNFTKRGKAISVLSGKSEKCLELLNQIFTQGEKALIFTQYREMGDILSQMVQDELQYQPLFFHGGVARNQREEMVQSFQDPDGPSLMIISLKAGGTGLNLTAANHVIHYDLWWNPAVENQATDRSYRIGQTKNVMVHRFITLKTFEEQIEEMLKKKQGLADQIIQTGERWITELSDEELKKLFSFNPESTVNSE